jgi:hypothetical protein
MQIFRCNLLNTNTHEPPVLEGSEKPPAMMIFVPTMLQVGFSRGRLREKTGTNVEFWILNTILVLIMTEPVV